MKTAMESAQELIDSIEDETLTDKEVKEIEDKVNNEIDAEITEAIKDLK